MYPDFSHRDLRDVVVEGSGLAGDQLDGHCHGPHSLFTEKLARFGMKQKLNT